MNWPGAFLLALTVLVYDVNWGEGSKDCKSFRPNGSLDYIQLDALIYKFKFRNGSRSGEGIVKDVQFMSETIVNTGEHVIIQPVAFHGRVNNTVQYSVALAFTQGHSTAVKPGVETEAETRVPLLVAGAKLRESLEANYHWKETFGDTNTAKISVNETEPVEIEQQVTVSACERCHISGFIKVVQDFIVDYTAEATVSGVDGEDKLSAEDIQKYLPPDWKYVKDHDEYSVDVAVKGRMMSKFALEPFITKDCRLTDDCKSEQFRLGMPIRQPEQFRESALHEGGLL